MFSDRTFNAVVLITNFAWAIRVINFRFVITANKKGNKEYCPVASFTKSKLLIVKVTLAVGILYLVYIAARSFETLVLKDEPASLEFVVKMSYLFSSYTLPVIVHITTVMKSQEVPAFITQYVQFFKDMKGMLLQCP